MAPETAKHRKFLLLIGIVFLVLALLVAGIVVGVRSMRRVLDQAGLSNALTLKLESFPRIDGTHFMQAFGEATVAELTGESIVKAREYLLFTGSESAMERLLSGDADIIIVSGTDAQDVLSRAKERGIELAYYTVAKDGLVLYVDSEDAETDVSSETFRTLYEQQNGEYAFSTYCYWLSSWTGKGTKLLSTDGVSPTEETIASGDYPFSYNVCAVFRAGGLATDAQRVVAWMLGEEGQSTLANLGYINKLGTKIEEGAGANAYTYYATRNETSLESTGIRVIKGAPGNPVTEGTKTTYLIENPTVWTTVKAEKGSYLALSGLADEAVQKAINDRILKAYEELAALPVPEFRGIRLEVPDGSIPVRTTVTATVLFNYNNIVSLRVQGDYTYAIPDETGEIGENAWGYYESTKTVSACDYLNFDLNSGHELLLENLFIDGCDFRDIVSLEILQDPTFLSAVTLTGSYKEVRADQKFYLTEDEIRIVFDHDSPEYILTEPVEKNVTIYFSDVSNVLALTARYYDAKTASSLYLNHTGENRILIPNRETADVTGTNEFTYGNIKVTQSWSYSSKLSAYAKRMVSNAYAVDWGVMGSLSRMDREATYTLDVSAQMMQNYLSLTVTDRRWLEGENDVTHTRFLCYNLDALTKASLSDLFWAGFDYEAVIQADLEEEVALRGGFVKTVRGETLLLSEEETNERIRSLTAKLTDFAIDNRQLYVAFDLSDLASGSASIVLTIPYAAFGSENITIFR